MVSSSSPGPQPFPRIGQVRRVHPADLLVQAALAGRSGVSRRCGSCISSRTVIAIPAPRPWSHSALLRGSRSSYPSMSQRGSFAPGSDGSAPAAIRILTASTSAGAAVTHAEPPQPAAGLAQQRRPARAHRLAPRGDRRGLPHLRHGRRGAHADRGHLRDQPDDPDEPPVLRPAGGSAPDPGAAQAARHHGPRSSSRATRRTATRTWCGPSPRRATRSRTTATSTRTPSAWTPRPRPRCSTSACGRSTTSPGSGPRATAPRCGR